MKNEIKHPLERYKLIADPTIRQQCIDNFNEDYYNDDKHLDDGSVEDAIFVMCLWSDTEQGYDYWEEIYNKIKRGTLPLLPEPIEGNPTLGDKTLLAKGDIYAEFNHLAEQYDQLRTENEKLREWIISIVNRSPMTTTQIQLILSPYDIHQAKQLLNK